MNTRNHLPVALTIAGSDSGAGAGIQADLLTFAANEVFGTTAITCLTAQNPDSVSSVHAAPGAIVREQAEQVARYFDIGAVKTGMLFNTEIIDAVSAFLSAHPNIPYILDPVMISTSGAKLLDEAALLAIRSQLIPRAALVTPNLDEAALFLGRRPAGIPLTQKDDALELAKKLGVPVLLKGGHASSAFEIVDAFATPEGNGFVLTSNRREDIDTHGSGCTLAAAITAGLAKGESLAEAIQSAHAYLQRGIHSGITVRDRVFISHFPPTDTAEAPRSVPLKQAEARVDAPPRLKKPTLAPRTPITDSAEPPVPPSYTAPSRMPKLPESIRQENQDAQIERAKFFKTLTVTLVAMCVVQAIMFPIPPLIWIGTAVYFIYKFNRLPSES